jgi:beta-glucosidase
MYQSEVVLASTFDPAMAEKEGAMYGNDALYTDTAALWAPGCNTHRTPMSGRNSEYFSEDSVLTSVMAKNMVTEGKKYGLIFSPKHFAFNDQDTHRNGLATFLNEQEAREIMLRAFEGPMSESLGTMSAYNRVGCVYGSSHIGLMREILRNEWGFKGYVITDAVGSKALSKYADGAASVVAGVTKFDTSLETLYCGSGAALSEDAVVSDPVLFKALRQAVHYNLYAFVNSNSMNGYTQNMKIVHETPYYQILVYVLDGVFAVFTAVSALGCIWLELRKEKKEA